MPLSFQVHIVSKIFISTSIYFVYDDNKAKTFRGKALLHYRVILMCWLWKNAFSDWIIRTGELVFLQIKKKFKQHRHAYETWYIPWHLIRTPHRRSTKIQWTKPYSVCTAICYFQPFLQGSGRTNIILFLTDGDPSDAEAGIYQAIDEGQASMVCNFAWVSLTRIF